MELIIATGCYTDFLYEYGYVVWLWQLVCLYALNLLVFGICVFFSPVLFKSTPINRGN